MKNQSTDGIGRDTQSKMKKRATRSGIVSGDMEFTKDDRIRRVILRTAPERALQDSKGKSRIDFQSSKTTRPKETEQQRTNQPCMLSSDRGKPE